MSAATSVAAASVFFIDSSPELLLCELLLLSSSLALAARDRNGRAFGPPVPVKSSTAHQRAAAVLERTERLGRRNGGADIVEVARMLGVGRLLHFVEVGVVDLAA